jgi:hypothetical protein
VRAAGHVPYGSYSDARSDTNPDANADTNTGTNANADTNARSDTNPDTNARSDTNTGTNADTNTSARAGPGALRRASPPRHGSCGEDRPLATNRGAHGCQASVRARSPPSSASAHPPALSS